MVNEATVVRSWKLLNLGDRFIEIHCGTLSNFMYGGNFMFLKKNKGVSFHEALTCQVYQPVQKMYAFTFTRPFQSRQTKSKPNKSTTLPYWPVRKTILCRMGCDSSVQTRAARFPFQCHDLSGICSYWRKPSPSVQFESLKQKDMLAYASIYHYKNKFH